MSSSEEEDTTSITYDDESDTTTCSQSESESGTAETSSSGNGSDDDSESDYSGGDDTESLDNEIADLLADANNAGQKDGDDDDDDEEVAPPIPKKAKKSAPAASVNCKLLPVAQVSQRLSSQPTLLLKHDLYSSAAAAMPEGGKALLKPYKGDNSDLIPLVLEADRDDVYTFHVTNEAGKKALLDLDRDVVRNGLLLVVAHHCRDQMAVESAIADEKFAKAWFTTVKEEQFTSFKWE